VLSWPGALVLTLTLLVGLGVPALAYAVRGRTYAVFAGVVLGFSFPGALVAYARLAPLIGDGLASVLTALFAYGIVTTGLHMAHLVRARLRGPLFRGLVSVPGQTFTAAGFMAGVWMLALLPFRLVLGWIGLDPLVDSLRWLDLAPFALAVLSVATSLRPNEEWVRIRLSGESSDTFERVPVERHRRRAPAPTADRPLRIVQITDPHLGPWQPVAGLRRHLERLLAHDPDLVLLTGDFLTMEGMGSPGALAEALAPLQAFADRSFAIFGNHDHESPEEVRSALERNRIRLLLDEEAIAETHAGPVQILGADYVGRGREKHLTGLLERYPARDGHLRLLLLHDPLGFRVVPDGAVDLTLSGHTHGGQVGLLSFGLDWTVLKRSRWPDHGLFAQGTNRLYVHRGTGFYGFPLRVGVPGELSVLELVSDPA
jgi:predicted MPP superfamily phosphohydrolase